MVWLREGDEVVLLRHARIVQAIYYSPVNIHHWVFKLLSLLPRPALQSSLFYCHPHPPPLQSVLLRPRSTRLVARPLDGVLDHGGEGLERAVGNLSLGRVALRCIRLRNVRHNHLVRHSQKQVVVRRGVTDAGIQQVMSGTYTTSKLTGMGKSRVCESSTLDVGSFEWVCATLSFGGSTSDELGVSPTWHLTTNSNR